MTTYTTPDSTIRTIHKDDPDFHITNGITMTPRAGFEILGKCPNEYKKIILQSYQNGWLKPVAYIKESEYMWEKLND